LKPIEAMPLVQISRSFVLDLRTKIFARRGRWMGNYCVTVLRIILGFAVDRGWLEVNALAERVKKIRKAANEGDMNRPWTEAECKIVLERAPAALKLALALAMCAGLRKSDFLTVTRSAVNDGTIAVRTSKRGTKVAVPLHPILSDALAHRPESNAVQIAVNSYGEPWTEGGFNASWRTFKKRLEAEGLIEVGLTPHGLRHTLGTRLREAGADDRTIADILGQKSVSMARHYSEHAALPAHAGALVLGLDHTNARSGSSGLSTHTKAPLRIRRR
jgi:integrase